MVKIRIHGLFLLLGMIFAGSAKAEETQSLAGTWQIRLDPKGLGLSQNWLDPQTPFENSISLPGTTDQARLGTPCRAEPEISKAGLAGLTRKFSYIGPAWYRRTIEIPKEWEGKRITLFLERVIWESRVWLDGKEIGQQNSLSTPHEFDLSSATPGKHNLLLRIDNRQQFDVGRAHAYIEDTQSIWNGVVGKIELRATPSVWIDQVHLNPDPTKPSVEIRIGNRTSKAGSGNLLLRISSGKISFEKSVPVKWDAQGGTVIQPLDFAGELSVWSEFHPNLHQLELILNSGDAQDKRKLSFGLRKIARSGMSITLNDLPVFFRGTHEGCSFPLTGYPPMDVEGWRRIFKVLKQWGLNHMRFHSYCPPEACFTAADQEGIYLQPELPLWTGKLDAAGDEKRVAWVREEARKVLEAYRNHPSMVLFCLGNELQGQFKFLQNLLGDLKKADPSRLYTMTSNRLWILDAPAKLGEPNMPPLVDDFLVERAFWNKKEKDGMRGQTFFAESPNTSIDFSQTLKRSPLPLLTHEVGQWNTFPNLAEIPKYTGVLRPINLEAIRDDLKKNGLLPQAADFTHASGKFCAELYKQELELALRSTPLAGYQLLDLHDYPGQGTAHVGLLDSFWDPKGFAKPAPFREACSPVVPLLRLPKRVYSSDETLSAKLEFVNYLEKPIFDVTPEWEIKASDGKLIGEGKLGPVNLPLGAAIPVGTLTVSLSSITQPTEATIRVSAPEACAMNSWKIWIVPAQPKLDSPKVLVTSSLAEAQARLAKGSTVLFLPTQGSIRQRQDTSFLPAFWSPVYFTNQAGTMGLLIQNKHPALADFPTEEYCNWQWWSLLTPCAGSVVLDQVKNIQPIVQTIDAFSRNQKLGLIFEAKVGSGRLLVCSANLSGDVDPMRRQMRASLVRYLSSPTPANLTKVSEGELSALFCEESHPSDSEKWSKDLEPVPVKK
jgi:Glycosyl hydrolases family 2, sugar binding domain/Glycosyl hydrolases family 2, TIM barrel domain